MIDLKWLEKTDESGQTGADLYKKSLEARKFPIQALTEILDLNKSRKELISKAEAAKAKQNKLSQEIPKLKKAGEDTTELMKTLGVLSSEVKAMEADASKVDLQVQDLLLRIPNHLHTSVPIGESEAHNKILKTVGEPKAFTFTAKEHFEIGEALDIIDFDRAAKVTGARFSFLKGAAARLERSLVQFMMDTHANAHGYTEMIPPYIVNSKSLTGTGNFPKFVEDVFSLAGTDYFLIPTAEVPVTNYYAGDVLNEKDLPQSFCAFSPCFRSEAGTYGRDTKGLIRQHQFNKVELMIFAHPEASYDLHEKLTSDAEKILEMLELPYRRSLLCSGDIGFGSAKTFDLEVWLPGQKAFREISSCSNFEDFQARRANIRFKSSQGKMQFVHTINGSGLAVGRTLVSILENYQEEDGSVTVPAVLRPYMGGLVKISNPN